MMASSGEGSPKRSRSIIHDPEASLQQDLEALWAEVEEIINSSPPMKSNMRAK